MVQNHLNSDKVPYSNPTNMHCCKCVSLNVLQSVPGFCFHYCLLNITIIMNTFVFKLPSSNRKNKMLYSPARDVGGQCTI